MLDVWTALIFFGVLLAGGLLIWRQARRSHASAGRLNLDTSPCVQAESQLVEDLAPLPSRASKSWCQWPAFKPRKSYWWLLDLLIRAMSQ
ncbi:hypothetical protein DFP86_10599 [Paludibacterium purpuratum]|uniref:Uncharacterized protein n=2 Tax=Paludibacterium purpuratum TaxID=1144873 RepID=A0A4R7B6D3_9NEIS|nr:hypothetical protein DFP86_10599 [Paludibacterium purpuratum]